MLASPAQNILGDMFPIARSMPMIFCMVMATSLSAGPSCLCGELMTVFLQSKHA